MTRALKTSALGLAVVAFLVFAPGAFASTLSESGNTAVWTAANGVSNDMSVDDTPTDVTIYTSDDPVVYDDQGGTSDQITPNCVDSDGDTNSPAGQVTCTTPPITNVVLNLQDLDDYADASSTHTHTITANGGDGQDEIYGGDQNDTLNGQADDDYLQGNGGGDTLDGGDGNDQLQGAGCDSCGPTPGDSGDTIIGGAGNDQAQGNVGNDSFDMGSGDDFAAGGPGSDTFTMGDGRDEAAGGPGDDVINGNAGDDELYGDCFGYNNCSGSDGRDTISGGTGDDYVDGDGGGDTLNGDSGDDYLQEWTDGAVDTIQGGDGVDTLEYDSTGGTSNNDETTASLDGNANDGYHNQSGSSSPDDPNNQFGADVEWMQIYTGDAPVVATGSAAANQIVTSNGADTVDAGNGADNVSTGDGNDTVNAADGYPDTVDCGDGVDTANVDQFDQTVHCETVNTTQRPSAFQTPEDLPPAVSWVTPTAGKAVSSSAKTHLQVNASDDHGVSKVEFYVGQRLVCTATSAPYGCDYQPTGADLGRNTLVAIAYDTAGQTSTALNSVSVPRFVPRSLTARTTPRKDTKVPFKFRTSGRVLPPGTVTTAQGCTGGHVTIQFRAGKKTVSSRRVATKANCTYSSTVTFRIPSRLNPKRLTVLVRFTGSTVLGPRSHKRYTVAVA